MNQRNLDIYGAEPIPWSRALEALEAGTGTYWLATVRPDGRPQWALYEVTPDTAFAVATADPHGATRWRFE